MRRQYSFGGDSSGSTIADAGQVVVNALGYQVLDDALDDLRGRAVRRTPRRLTLAHEIAGHCLFRKLRTSRPGDARNEWRRLHELASLGVDAPTPLFLFVRRRRSALGMAAVEGRPIRDLLAAAPRGFDPWPFLLARVVPTVQRLHGAGLFHRDLYWNHLFAETLDADGPPVALIDVERVFRPRLRTRRWLVKDLASLLATWPEQPAPALGLRFLRAIGLPRDRRLLRAIVSKAERVRRHRPRYSGEPVRGTEGWPG